MHYEPGKDNLGVANGYLEIIWIQRVNTVSWALYDIGLFARLFICHAQL